MTFYSNAVQRIQPSATMLVAQRARDLKIQGRDIISLSTGEPDFATPAHIQEAARKAAAEGKTKYPPVNGVNELREAVVRKFKAENGIDYDPAQVIVCNGAKQAISNALIATVNAGDEVIIPVPYWVSYPELVTLLGGVPVYAQTSAPGFKLSAAELEARITPRTKWLVLNSPCNPTGATYSAAELRQLAQVLLRHPQVHVMTDDIYEHLVYDDNVFATLAQVEPSLKDRTLTINGVSKAYAMTGWRIGYAAGESGLIKTMAKVQSQLTSGACSVAQWAAVAALTGPLEQVRQFQAVYAQRRALASDILANAPGLECSRPEGAFYLFPNCEALLGRNAPDGKPLDTDVDFCAALLDATGVAAVPGTAFGRPGNFRITYAIETAALKEACERTKRFCETLE
ncbi:pyridoxal phosphate-dependent aminotransferase [Bordetella sp. BOR01]|uniref:pyridoxal phosphate-dependent aminotransferase n=1 Tax=Bordetella sp. BOR01 TaxID=2854779 RepID=UPI001C43ABF8|nr:pyridoxal phosphate-dependent aminotransferase [Bordetella sp. BOR01]